MSAVSGQRLPFANHVNAPPSIQESGTTDGKAGATSAFFRAYEEHTDRAIYALVLTAGNAISAVTWHPNGYTTGIAQPLTQVASVGKVTVWRILDPDPSVHPTNPGNLRVVALTGSGNKLFAWRYLSGVDQSQPEAAVGTSSGSGAGSSVSVGATSVDLVIDAAGYVDSNVPTPTPVPGAGQQNALTRVQNNAFGQSDAAMGSSTHATSPTWSFGGSYNWDAVAVAVRGHGTPLPYEPFLGLGRTGHGRMLARFESDPVNTALGNYAYAATDLSLPGRGLGFAFTRTYNSLDTTVGSLGPGWTHSYDAKLAFETGGEIRFHAEDGAEFVYEPDGQGGFATPAVAHSALAQLGDGTYEITRRDQVTYHFAADGRLLDLADRNGNTITFGYTGGLLTTITDTVGRSISLGYDANDRLTTLNGPPSRSTAYTYDASGRLATVTDTLSGVWQYGYDASDRLTTVVDPNSHALLTNTYGADGRVATQTNAVNETGTFDWNPVTQTSTYTDARGGEWVDVYDGNVLQSSTDPLDNTTTYAYDAALNVAAVTDPRGNTTTMTYDTAGNLLTRTAPAPLSYVETWTYTALNDVATYTDSRSNTTTFSYDAAGNLTQVSAPLSSVTQYGRDPGGTGLLASMTDPRGKTTSFTYDGDANLSTATSPLGHVTTMTHDAAGRTLTAVDPRGNAVGANPADYTTTFTHDAADRLLTTTDPLGNVRTQTYDPLGNLLTVTDANQNTTDYGYDAANRLTSVNDPLDRVTAYAYDAVGNLSTRTDANDHVTTYAYDLAGRLTSTTDPLTHTWTLTYDPAGNVATRTDANAQTTTYGYDEINRLTAITYAAPSTPAVTYAYDANSNRTSMSDGAGSETSTFDALNRLTAVTRGNDTFSYGYDVAGNVTSRTYPGQAAQTFTYDDDGRLVTANGAAYGFDPAGNLLTAATGDGLTARSTYDEAGRLLEVAHTSATATLSRFSYAHDAVGNRTAMTTREGTVTYRYDALNRLTEACWSPTSCPGGAPASPLPCLECIGNNLTRPATSVTPPAGETYRTYTYDPVGNRLTEASDALGVTTERISESSQGAQGNGNSNNTHLSADGRYVVFHSAADNLVANDTNASDDVFIHDRVTDTTTRVSVASDGTQGNDDSQDPVISADGRYVAFRSYASNLVSGDTNGQRDIFVHDILSGETTRVSINSSGGQANGFKDDPAISGDGRYIAFSSSSSNIVPNDTNGKIDVFVHDRTTGTTSLVSMASDGTQGDGPSTSPFISRDGRWVAFDSTATNLVAGDTNAVRDAFVHDRDTGTTSRVSESSGGTQGNDVSENPGLSAEGRYVAFESVATNLVAGDTNTKRDIFLHDTQTGSTELVSLDDAGSQTNNESRGAAISADGRWVAFMSQASNLVSGDTNGVKDVFIRDRQTATVKRWSLAHDGTQGNQHSTGPAVPSDDGKHLAFISTASDLVPGDTNGSSDVFVRSEASNLLTSAYDAADRLISVTPLGASPISYSFDANGNQTAAGAVTYTYDLADRLATATVGATIETYTYAGDGTRLSASTGAGVSQTTNFLWDRAFGLPQLALERDGADALLRSYRYGLDRLTITDATATSWYHHDGLGSVVDVTDAGGSSMAWSESYPYGVVRLAGTDPGAPTGQPFGFAGEQLDSVTGLYHLRARQYDPGTGRFLTTDPVALPISDPYVASYVYVGNNPALLTDPSGRCPFCVVAAIFAAPAVLEAAAAAVVVTGAAVGAAAAGVWVGHELAKGKEPPKPPYPESWPKLDPRPDPQTQKAADYLANQLRRLGQDDGPGPQFPGSGYCGRHRNVCRAGLAGLLLLGLATGTLILGPEIVGASQDPHYLRSDGTIK